MGWAVVARFKKSEGATEELRDYIQNAKKHWEEVALDVGYDPQKNVKVEEDDQEMRAMISSEMDELFRTEAGSYRYDIPGDVIE